MEKDVESPRLKVLVPYRISRSAALVDLVPSSISVSLFGEEEDITQLCANILLSAQPKFTQYNNTSLEETYQRCYCFTKRRRQSQDNIVKRMLIALALIKVSRPGITCKP